MADGFPKILKDEKPTLVVWQTGTADAMRGVGADSFQTTLEAAVDKLQAGGADVIFMNMQYSPRTDAVISTAPYADAIRWVGLEHAVNVFDRFGSCVSGASSERSIFSRDQVARYCRQGAYCIGRLLAIWLSKRVDGPGKEGHHQAMSRVLPSSAAGAASIRAGLVLCGPLR